MSAAIAEQLLNFSSLRSSRGRTATAFWFTFLVSEAARLRHGRDAEVSRPGLQLGRARTRRHRVDTCASVSCPARESASLTPSGVLAQITARTSTLFRLHRWPDSSALRPLHSLTHSASPIRQDAFAHSDSRKLPRPALTVVHPKMTTEAAMLRISAKIRIMAARLRPAKRSALWARCSACRPGHRHSRETDQLCFAAVTNRPDSLRKPN